LREARPLHNIGRVQAGDDGGKRDQPPRCRVARRDADRREDLPKGENVSRRTSPGRP